MKDIDKTLLDKILKRLTKWETTPVPTEVLKRMVRVIEVADRVQAGISPPLALLGPLRSLRRMLNRVTE